MKILLLRIGALGTVVILGWIAIANAQRGNDNLTPDDSAGGGSLTVAEGSNRPVLTPPTSEVNPLRSSTSAPSQTVQVPASSTAAPAARRPAADPFGLSARRNENTASGPSSARPATSSSPYGNNANAINAVEKDRYPQNKVVPASAEQPANGPSLMPAETNRSADNRYAARPERAAAPRGNERYPASPTVDTQEPAQFKADPFAMPANQPRALKSDRTASAPETNRRVTEPVAESEGTGQPGAKQLEGVQAPQLMIQKLAPKEVQVGKPASFRTVVKNVGQIPACAVEIHDLVPKGTSLRGTVPRATTGARGEIVWTLGTIGPGEETAVEMQLIPTSEGEIGSVATVLFGADASARCIATRPQLVVETSAPRKVLIGDKLNLTITISNPGTGTATGVVVEERIPPGLQHPAGTELEYEVGDLKPGESRKLELPMTAGRPGPLTNMLSARGDGNLRAEDKFDIEVLAPQLDVVMEGPKRRYLERQATYQLSVTNPGTAPAKQVELAASLPQGLKFVSANNAGYYEESTRTVRWRLEELPANETGSVELVTMPVEAGQYALKLRGTAQKGLTAEKEQPVMVEGLAAILFQVADTADPLELGGETTYEVHVLNQGSKAASNVRLAVIIPPELKATAAEGPTRHTVESDRITFDGLSRLAPKADTTYRIRAKALKAGDLRVRFQLLTDDMQTPVTKEESTRVFADE